MTGRSEAALTLRNVTINFLQGTSLFARRRPPFCAVKDVTFDVAHGDSIGIVGRNGAGKTTLLKAIADIIQPDHGRIERFVSSITLLALGVGFVPQISACDNVVLNGMLLGTPRRHMQEKLDAIFDFAELEDFRDVPLKNYSAGMRARLAFSTAIHIRTDVLLIDEVLAVGDRDFRVKSQKVMEQKLVSGDTIVLVSHQSSLITRLCNRAIWIEDGEMVLDGAASEVIAEYEGYAQRADVD